MWEAGSRSAGASRPTLLRREGAVLRTVGAMCVPVLALFLRGLGASAGCGAPGGQSP